MHVNWILTCARFCCFYRVARVVATETRWNLGLLCVFAPDQAVRREKSLWGSTLWRLCLGGTKRDMFARGPHQLGFLLCQGILEALTRWLRGKNLVSWTKTLSPSRTTSHLWKPSSECTRRMRWCQTRGRCLPFHIHQHGKMKNSSGRTGRIPLEFNLECFSVQLPWVHVIVAKSCMYIRKVSCEKPFLTILTFWWAGPRP